MNYGVYSGESYNNNNSKYTTFDNIDSTMNNVSLK